MSNLISSLFNKLIAPLSAEYFEYQVADKASNVAANLNDVLTSKEANNSPNIRGKVNGNFFYAQPRSSFIVINRGHEPAVHINGEIKEIDNSSTCISIKIDVTPAFVLPILFALSGIAYLVYFIVFMHRFNLSYNDWEFTLTLSFFVAIGTYIAFNVPMAQKGSLRYSFEKGMGIQPIDTHSV